MPITGQKIEIWRGDTKILVVSITGPDGAPFDMVGTSAEWWVARSFKSYDNDILIRKSSAGGGITITATGVEIELHQDDTDIPASHYYHELKIFGGTDVSTAMTGDFVIHEALDMTLPYGVAPEQVRLVAGEYAIPVKYASDRHGLDGPPLRPLRTVGY